MRALDELLAEVGGLVEVQRREDELAELRCVIWTCRDFRKYYLARGDYGGVIFSERKYREARARYRTVRLSFNAEGAEARR